MRTRVVGVLLAGIFGMASVVGLPVPGADAAPAGAQEASRHGLGGDRRIPTDQVIVKVPPSAHLDLVGMSNDAGASVVPVRRMDDETWVVKLPSRRPVPDVEAVGREWASKGRVEFAEPDEIRFPLAVPNDPQYSLQWHYHPVTGSNYGINLPPAWDVTTGDPGIKIAVVDSGVVNHADLAGRFTGGYDFVSDPVRANDGDGRDPDPSDPGDWVTSAESSSGPLAGCPVRNSSWHGSHVGGTVGAASDNGIGVSGVTWSSTWIPVRVIGKCGGFVSDIMDGIKWAAGGSVTGVPANPNPAKVINLSLGGFGSCSLSEQTAINTAIALGATVVTASGNSDDDSSFYAPGNCSGVVNIAATTQSGQKASYSNYGVNIAVSAPGGSPSGSGIRSTVNAGTTVPTTDAYTSYVGTSMAAPHVSGVVALMLAVNPSLSVSAIKQILRDTATPFPAGSTCNTTICGAGIVNAGNAVAAAAGGGPPPACPTPTSVSYLAEGSTGPGFDTWVLASNAGTAPAKICLTFLTGVGPITGPSFDVQPQTRLSIRASDFVVDYDLAMIVEAQGGEVAVERAVYSVIPGKTGAHVGKATAAPAGEWFLPEGAADGGFETWALVANPSTTQSSTVLLTFMTGTGPVDGPTYILPPGSRKSVRVNDFVTTFDVSTKVTVLSGADVVAERSTYVNHPGLAGATSSPGTSTSAGELFMAEGATAGGFETWALVANPSTTQSSTVLLTFMTGTGPVDGPTHILPPGSRKSVRVNDFVTTFDVSTKVTVLSGADVVAERAMYNKNHPTLGTGSATGEAVTASESKWIAVEGATAGGFETWVLVSNPHQSQSSQVTLTFMIGSGPVSGPLLSLQPSSRKSVRVNDFVTTFDVSTKVTVLSGADVVAERSVYTPPGVLRDATAGPGIPIA